MKIKIPTLVGLALLLLSSFSIAKETTCEQVELSIEFVQKEIISALKEKDFNTSKQFTNNAVDTFNKSKEQLVICQCNEAKTYINKGFENLILASKSTSLEKSKSLLNQSLEGVALGLRKLKGYNLHNQDATGNMDSKLIINPKLTEKHKERIDIALANYESSLSEVVASVDCEKASAFAKKIAESCEKELLKETLTETKRYYNEKTKEITQRALEKLGDCSTN